MSSENWTCYHGQQADMTQVTQKQLSLTEPLGSDSYTQSLLTRRRESLQRCTERWCVVNYCACPSLKDVSKTTENTWLCSAYL